MSNNLLIVKNLTKSYKKFNNKFLAMLNVLFFNSLKNYQQHTVIENISFSLKKGESLGIVGLNGAGKSTLLKIISGVTLPTSGHFISNGTISAILELGIGFNEEFTGRENVYAAPLFQNLSKKQIHKLSYEIFEFSELGKYIDEKVKVYSSGMRMRLAFSLATSVSPDILIIDEALSVGDAYFQHKCLERIRDLKEKGTSLIIVSHDKQVILNFCDKAILIDKSKQKMIGNPIKVLDTYNALISGYAPESFSKNDFITKKIQSGSKKAKVTNLSIINLSSIKDKKIYVGDYIKIVIELKVDEIIDDLVVGLMIRDKYGNPIYGTNTFHQNIKLGKLKKNSNINISFSFKANLGPMTYSITTGLHSTDGHLAGNYEWTDSLLYFKVEEKGNFFIGSNFLDAKVNIDDK